MKLLAISDIHGDLYQVAKLVRILSEEEYDIILIAGDLTDFGSVNNVVEILDQISRLRHKTLLYIPGNCDPRELLEKGAKNYENHWIHGKVVRINNLVIAGIGGSNISPFRTPSELTEDEIKLLLKDIAKQWKKLEGLRILVSHTPPYNTNLDLTFLNEHVGSRTLRTFIEKENVKLCICGHIHEARGTDLLKKTFLVNPGPLKKGFYAEIEIMGKNEIKINLRRC